MELKIGLVIFFLFFFLFLFASIVLFFLGLYSIHYRGLLVEVILPYNLMVEIPLCICVDYVSLFFFSVVSLISRVVFLYRKFYIEERWQKFFINSRFFFLLFLFVLSIIILVFSGSWVIVIVGWDGLGLVSFLLVVYYNNRSSIDSGLITVFTNRLGDCLFILSFIFILYCGWFTIEFLSFYGCIFFLFVLFVGAITKRAQLPFSSWLPAAMAAPTPVSSLVHSSTLVTAGVYLLLRFNFLFNSVNFILILISLFTIFLAGLCAIYELDFKKVVAMSTLRQLGFMIFSISSGLWLFGFLHIIFHAFFKSSLFLSTGNIIHYLLGDQDSRYFGALGGSYFSKLIFVLSSISLIGFPFSIGFYSKDTILGNLSFTRISFVSFIFFVSCCFTVAYRVRLIFMGFTRFPAFSSRLSFKEDRYFYYPLVLLFFSCVLLGNFFFFNFVPIEIFSLFDLILGLIIILLGLIIFFTSPKVYFFINYFMSISFLSLISSSYFSSFLSYFSFKREYTWGEIFGGQGYSLLIFHSYKYTNRLYLLNFAYFFIILFIFFVVRKLFF